MTTFMRNASVVAVLLGAVFLSACTPPLGSLRLTPDAAVLTDAAARAGHIGIAVFYDGEGFDPAKLSVYAALGDDPWQLALTDRKQCDRFEVLWPGGLAPPVDPEGEWVDPVVVRIQAVYSDGRQSVSARTSVTIRPH